MEGQTCDLCGKVLLADEDVRYVVRVEVYAAYDPMELTSKDLARDYRDELRRLLEQMRTMTADQLQDQVYRSFYFDLCPACQRAYLKDPLGRRGGAAPSA